MDKPGWVKEIKVLVWDLDGTLYKEIPQVKAGIEKKCIEVVAEAESLSLEKAKELFFSTREKLKSNTRSLLYLGVDREYVMSGEWSNIFRLKYLRKDSNLLKMFQQLKALRHILSTNSNGVVARKKLKKIGLPFDVFEKLFCHVDLGILKPEPEAFTIVLQFTKLKPHEHLFIGDSEGKEMIPASKVGFRTCFVWGKSKFSDISLRTVYDTVELFN
ncbi:MAG TPA: HAD family hydrolase [Candidatus Bathyarchaeia archaeon]|nr:HAD family hydrolase [Candidatus Bathyarchaeia archaeon]